MILYRQLVRELYLTLLLIMVIVIALFSINQLMLYLKAAAIGKITLMAVLRLMGLEIPLLFAFLLPLGWYIALLLVMGRMYLDSEMTVLSACGLGPGRLFAMIMSFAVVLFLGVLWIMAVADPVIETAQNYWYSRSVAEMSTEKIIPGSFTSLGRGRVIYANSASLDRKSLRHVFLAQRVNHPNQRAPHWDVVVANQAKQATYRQGAAPFLVFHDGYRVGGSADQAALTLSRFHEYGIKIPGIRPRVDMWPDDAPFMVLMKLAQHDPRAAATFQWRVSAALMVLVLTLIAFPLSVVNPRQGKFLRFFPALLLYFLYANTLYVLRDKIEHGAIPLQWGMWWVHGVMLLVAAGLWCWRFGWFGFQRQGRA